MTNTFIILTLFVLLVVSGCGTISNQMMLNGNENDTRPICEKPNEPTNIVYGGTFTDIYHWILFPFTCHGEGCIAGVFYPVILPFGIIDLPLSFAADTIILPYTIPLSLSTECTKI